ncbi:UNVERIFIED_CONTAM: 1-acyl-sn-glycerol-3-phosphate acyltransferase 2 [Sesamum calycinum]|uniref:1-acylglycerol-3-phosphate O-acyltransferase n=1 Tax=Sesamum calycinum TaxID=2727403 RepID=A0AAW2SA05_9LAMI
MAIAAAVVLPLGILFLLSGFIVNLIQPLSLMALHDFGRHVSSSSPLRIGISLMLSLCPYSSSVKKCLQKDQQRNNRTTVVGAYLAFRLVGKYQVVTGGQVELFVDQETFDLLGKERALLICNHRSDIDWLVGWVLAQRAGCLGSSLAMIKKSSLFLPVIGWSMWFSDYIFLERNWAKDENTLKSGLAALNDFPLPFWLALFVEGTRFTQAKLEAAQEYAASAGLPVPRNGFVAAVTHLRSFVPVIYNITVAIPKNEPQPTLLKIFRGRSSAVHVHIERHIMRDLPETSSGISQWCKDMFVAKDALLERHLATNTFGDEIRHDIGRPKKSLLAIHSSKAVGEPPLFLASAVFFAINDAIIAARAEEALTAWFPLDNPATPERKRMACIDEFTKPFIDSDFRPELSV